MYESTKDPPEKLKPLKLGACPKCGSEKVDATLRVANGMYCRCQDCGYMWFVEIDKV